MIQHAMPVGAAHTATWRSRSVRYLHATDWGWAGGAHIRTSRVRLSGVIDPACCRFLAAFFAFIWRASSVVIAMIASMS